MPSRAMLMTSKGLFDLEDSGRSIPEDHVLLGELLQKNGYNTFGAGKWHNGTSSYARSFNDGANIFFGGMHDHWNVPAYNFDPTGKYEQTAPLCPDYLYSNRTITAICDHTSPGKHSTDLFTDSTIDYLKSYDDDKPFFAYVSFMAPHDPRTMPKEFLEMYDPDKIKIPPNFMPAHPFDNGDLDVRDELLAAKPRTEKEIARHIAEYYAMITHLDYRMGKVIEALEQSGKLEDTVIVFAGDNGLAIGRHGLMGKQNMYEHSLGVPLIFSGPAIPKGQTTESFCYLLDIFPTLCQLTDIEPPENIRGKSLVPAIQNPNQSVRNSLYFAYRSFQRAIRKGNLKLIEYVVNKKRTTQLFDIEADPWENKDLSGCPDSVEVVEELRRELISQKNYWNDSDPEFWVAFE